MAQLLVFLFDNVLQLLELLGSFFFDIIFSNPESVPNITKELVNFLKPLRFSRWAQIAQMLDDLILSLLQVDISDFKLFLLDLSILEFPVSYQFFGCDYGLSLLINS